MEQKIKTIISQTNIGNLKSYTWLGNGFSSNAYQLDTSTGSYVLLETKKNAVEATSYKTYFANLKCLERSGFEHAPKAVYLSKDARLMVTTKVQGTVISALNKPGTDERKALALTLTDVLMQLKAVRQETLAEELAAVGVEPPKPFTYKQDWEKYVINTFYPYTSMAPHDAQTEWIEQQITNYKLTNADGEEAVFHHGDTSEPNILVTDSNTINLIDWGSARFYASSRSFEDFGLSYTMNHVEVIREFQDDVLRHVAAMQHVDYEVLKDTVFERRKEIKIADIAWAYMMYTRAAGGEVSDPPETFKTILDKRVQEYTTDFL